MYKQARPPFNKWEKH